jgi:hypothetical protein
VSKLSVNVESFKPLRSNKLFGFANILIPELHLRIREATVHESHGKRWVGLPAKLLISREGSVRRDERGKIAYSGILQITDGATRDAFSQPRLRLCSKSFPMRSLDGGAGCPHGGPARPAQGRLRSDPLRSKRPDMMEKWA